MSVLHPSSPSGPPGASALTAFDFSAIEECDPALKEGYRLVFDRECPMELRLTVSDPGAEEIGNLEPVKARIFVAGPEVTPSDVRLLLINENDVFFQYSLHLDQPKFSELQSRQHLMVELANFPTVLMKMFNSCIKDPHSFLAVLHMDKGGAARLEFVQNVEYRYVELLAIDVEQDTEASVREQIGYRYNALKSKLALLQARLQDINTVLKLKNPSLFLTLQKTAGIKRT